MTVFVFDLDNTLCHTSQTDYENSTPCRDIIDKVNQLYDQGHTIKIFTGRGSQSGIDWREFTENQLKSWGLKYHQLVMGKPSADIYIDDKGVNSKEWLRNLRGLP